MERHGTSIWVYVLVAVNAVFMLVTLFHYPGNAVIYIVFSILLNALLFAGLNRTSIFFDTFLGVFFWLGFWLKFSVRMVFTDGKFHESVGFFDYSADAYDRALLVTSCGITGLLVARLIREKILFEHLANFRSVALEGLRAVYARHRKAIWFGFFVLTLGVAVSNGYLGIYQRGTAPQTVLPYGLGGVYTWLLLFGASSISAVMLHFELQLHARIAYVLILLVLLETFLSNVSMLSRGMILNAGALMLGAYVCARAYDISLGLRTPMLTIAAFLGLFVASIVVVNHLRMGFYGDKPIVVSESLQKLDVSGRRVGNIGLESTILFIDRWVGMEGVMSVTSYPKLGWDLWEEAWQEKYSDRGTSLYDRKISKAAAKYDPADLSIHHFITLPGILGFFFYPGSYVFLFVSMLALGLLGAAIEAAVYKWGGGNLILCSLMALVVAYRYVHFGYVPGRSYLLSGALVLNVALIYLMGRVLAYRHDAKEAPPRLE